MLKVYELIFYMLCLINMEILIFIIISIILLKGCENLYNPYKKKF